MCWHPSPPFVGRNNKLVCGLDVAWNLQVITRDENRFKNNKFDGTYDNKGWRDDYNLVREGEI